MMVCDLDRMPQAEYLKWNVYYQRKAQRKQLEQLKAEAKAKG